MFKLTKIVVTGNINSGKSTLIGRYLYESGSLSQGSIDDIQLICKNLKRNFEFAYLLDSFEEERKEELTIDTTQCFTKPNKNKTLVFIDVPGHLELLKNMLSGASCADTAILTIDINKPIEDQTKRHAFILNFLGIPEIITVINKMDSVSFNETKFLETRGKIAQVFKKLGIKFNECVPVCASQGDNLLKKSNKMPWYKGKTLKELLNSFKIKESADNFRFLVQDIYKNKQEKIAAGIILSGNIKVNNKIFILPEKKMSQIKIIKHFNKKIKVAKAPLAMGIILKKMGTLKRGQILSDNQLPMVTKTIPSKIICTKNINLNDTFQMHCMAQKTKTIIKKIVYVREAKSFKLKNCQLKKNSLAEVILESKNKIVVEKHNGSNSLGRFVLIDNQKRIAAIGTVL